MVLDLDAQMGYGVSGIALVPALLLASHEARFLDRPGRLSARPDSKGVGVG